MEKRTRRFAVKVMALFVFIIMLCQMPSSAFIMADSKNSNNKNPNSGSLNRSYPNVMSLYVNGLLYEIDSYVVKGNTYYKLDNIAAILKGTEAEFDYFHKDGKINIENGTGFYGGLDKRSLRNLKPQDISEPIEITVVSKGKEYTTYAYALDSRWYFKLRDLAEVLDINIEWKGKEKAIYITTKSADGTTKSGIVPKDDKNKAKNYKVIVNNLVVDNNMLNFDVTVKMLNGNKIPRNSFVTFRSIDLINKDRNILYHGDNYHGGFEFFPYYNPTEDSIRGNIVIPKPLNYFNINKISDCSLVFKDMVVYNSQGIKDTSFNVTKYYKEHKELHGQTIEKNFVDSDLVYVSEPLLPTKNLNLSIGPDTGFVISNIIDDGIYTYIRVDTSKIGGWVQNIHLITNFADQVFYHKHENNVYGFVYKTEGKELFITNYDCKVPLFAEDGKCDEVNLAKIPVSVSNVLEQYTYQDTKISLTDFSIAFDYRIESEPSIEIDKIGGYGSFADYYTKAGEKITNCSYATLNNRTRYDGVFSFGDDFDYKSFGAIVVKIDYVLNGEEVTEYDIILGFDGKELHSVRATSFEEAQKIIIDYYKGK